MKKVPIHLQSSQNRLIIKNGTVVNWDGEEQVDIYIEVRSASTSCFYITRTRSRFGCVVQWWRHR